MNSKTCYVLVGPPGSGKSTYADNTIYDAIIVSSDDVIQTICEDYGITYDEGFPDLVKFADKMFWFALKRCADNGINIVVDRTNMSVKSRKKIFDVMSSYGYNFYAKVFPMPEKEEWNRRLNSRNGKTIPSDVLEGMIKNFEMPTVEEGFVSVEIIENA